MKCYFFGTFNPIHKGHITAADKIKELFNFDEVIFVPAFYPPHKSQNIESARHRLNMIKAAEQKVSDVEFHLPLPSYTFRTIEKLASKKNEKIYFIIGYDAFSKIESWKNPEYLKEKLNFIVVPRHFEDKIDLEHLKKRDWQFEVAGVDFIDVSSQNIRKKLYAGASITDLVPQKTEEYIYEHGLYKTLAQRKFEQ